MKDFIVFGKPSIDNNEIDAVTKVLRSGWLGTGDVTKEFEKAFSLYKGVSVSIALNSATAGLHLANTILNLKPGDEVITTAMTFCSTINTIIHAGGKPVLVDICPETWNIDVKKIEERINENTRAIVPVHFTGRSCEMDKIISLARKYNLTVIEDCAHAIESTYNGVPCGTIGDFGVFSFYATKNLSIGEGGMIISNRVSDMEMIRKIRLHGMSKDAHKRFSSEGFKPYDLDFFGYKYNLPDILSAIGLEQLKKIEDFHSRRKEIWGAYMSGINNSSIQLPWKENKNSKHGYHLFILKLPSKLAQSRLKFLNYLTEARIGSGIHYEAIPSFKIYKPILSKDDYTKTMIAQDFGKTCISLPLSPAMSDNEVDYVIDNVNSIIQKLV